MKRYETYKDSGVKWESKIPSNWRVKKLGHIGDFSASGIDKKILKNEKITSGNHRSNLF